MNDREIISYLDSTYSYFLNLYRRGEYHVFLEKFETSVIKHLKNIKISVDYGEKPLRIKHDRYVELFGEIEEDRSLVYKDNYSGILYVRVERVTKKVKVNNCDQNVNNEVTKQTDDQMLDKSNNNVVERPKTNAGKMIVVPMTRAVQIIVRQTNQNNNILEAAVKDLAHDEKIVSSYVRLEKLDEKKLTWNNKSYHFVNSHLKKIKAKKNSKSSEKISKKKRNKEMKRYLSGVKKRTKNVRNEMIIQNAIVASRVEPTQNEIVYKNTIHETISITQEAIDSFTKEKDRALVYLLFVKLVADLERKCSILTWKEIEACVTNVISEVKKDTRTDDQNKTILHNVSRMTDEEIKFFDFLQLFTFENGRNPLIGIPDAMAQSNNNNQTNEVVLKEGINADDQNSEKEEAVIQSMSSLMIEQDKNTTQEERSEIIKSVETDKLEDSDVIIIDEEEEDPLPDKDAITDVVTATESTQPQDIEDDIIQISNVNKSFLSEYIKNSEKTTGSENCNALTKYWNKNPFNISDVIKDTIDGRLKEFQDSILQVISSLMPFTPPASANLCRALGTSQTTEIPINNVSPILPVPLPPHQNIPVQTESSVQLPLNNQYLEPCQGNSNTVQPTIVQSPIVSPEAWHKQTKAPPKPKKPRKPYVRRQTSFATTTSADHNYINFAQPQQVTCPAIHQQFQPNESENHPYMMQRQQNSNQGLTMEQNMTNLPSPQQNISNFHHNELINPLRGLRLSLNMNRPRNPSQIHPELSQFIRNQVPQPNYYRTAIRNPPNILPSYPTFYNQSQIANEQQNMQEPPFLMPYSRERNSPYDVPIRTYENQHYNLFETQQRKQHR